MILCFCSLPSETLFLGVSLLGVPASFMKMARRYQASPAVFQYREERDPFLFVLLPVPRDSYRTRRRGVPPRSNIGTGAAFRNSQYE
jgi:hypothetical protein